MTTAATAKKPSVWEDFVDIFIAPAEVFARREDGRFGIALLVLAVLITVLAIGTRSLMQPVFDAEFNRQMALAMKKPGMRGKTEASTTRRPGTPCTRKSVSSTPPRSFGPIAQVPQA